jgi:hypothetical protein
MALVIGYAATSCSSSSEPGVAVGIHFHVAPSFNVAAGSTLGTVVVGVIDERGNVVDGPTPTISLKLSGTSTPLLGTTSAPVVGGLATFNDLSVQKSGTYKLVASAPGLDSATAMFAVLSGPCSKLIFTTEPGGAKAGVAMPAFSVACGDQYGNPPSIPPGGSMTVVIALGANPAGANLTGTLTRSGFAAVVSFNDIAIDKAASGYTLVATSTDRPTLTAATSSAFTITP